MKHFCFSTFFLLLFVSVFSQVNQFGIPFISNYSPQDYVASEQNWSIVQDHRGVMYFGNTDNGVLEYDGVHWRKIPIDNNSIVRSLAIDTDGKIYVGAVGEFGLLAPDKTGKLFYSSLIHLLDTSDQNFSDVWKTYTTDKGVFFCTTTKIFLFLNDTIQTIPLKNGAFFSFYVDNKLYNGHYLNGLELFYDGSFQLVRKGEFFSRKGIYTMNNYLGNSLLIGSFPFGLYTYLTENGAVENNFLNTPANKYLKENQLYNSFKLDKNHFAFSTLGGGVIVMDKSGNIVSRYSKEEGLQNETAINLYANKKNFESPLWLALDIGISKIEMNSPIRKFGELNGLNGAVYDIQKLENSLYVATTLGVFRLQFDDNNIPRFQKVNGIEGQTWSLIEFKYPGTNEKILLAGTINGLYTIGKNGKSNYIDHQIRKKDEPDRNIYITKLSRSNKDNLTVHVGMVNGFLSIVYKNGRWKRKLVYKEISDEIRNITEDKFGNIWLGTYLNGLIQIEEKNDGYSVNRFQKNAGLPGNKAIYLSNFNDQVIFGTNKGIYSFNAEKKQFEPGQYFGFDGLTDYHISCFSQKDDSTFIVSAYNADERWVEMGHLRNGEIVYDRKPFLRLPNEQVDAIYHDIDGVSWLGNASGVYSFNAYFQKNYNQQYHALIRRISTVEDSVLFNGTYYEVINSDHYKVAIVQPDALKPELDYKHNSLIFEFAAPFFEEEKKTQYSYTLEGYKETWSKWSAEPKAVFTNLNEGKYNFMVKAKNIYGNESTIASYKFSISPPWYRTIVAYIVYGILAIIIVYIIVKLYTRKLELEKIRLEGIVEERTAEIRNKNVELENKNEEITKQRDQIVKQKEHITDSIKYAQKIQQAVVPSDEKKNELLKDHFLLWLPRDIVSGDFWWMTEKENKVILAAADCTGHGVPGAFMSMLGVSFLNEIVNKLEDVHAHLILNQLRANVKSTLKQTGKEGEAKDGMDIAMVIFDRENMTMEYSGAYNPLYLIRNGELLETKADKNPIGIYIREKDSFTLHNIELEKGDTIYIFSDGFVDQFGGEKKDKYKSRRFKQFLIDIQDKSMPEQHEILYKELHDWRGDLEQIDDVIVIGVRF